eukprot:TRINITY_DN16502_c0_g1_i1.p2 TRINITY_DN16502_c0_g1~~TRINITY_DN16502_c0_g1_i1.p2  ORF type:complete len:112 (+),score=23.14 TRINITY_DN16502_c0_g1_i1:197-532(+)
MLSRFTNFHIQEAENGKVAIEKILDKLNNPDQQKKIFDIIFMDINMPVMNGLEATMQINKLKLTHPQLSETKIIINSAFQETTNSNEIQEANPTAFITCLLYTSPSPRDQA